VIRVMSETGFICIFCMVGIELFLERQFLQGKMSDFGLSTFTSLQRSKLYGLTKVMFMCTSQGFH
jgi:hypothetical protein